MDLLSARPWAALLAGAGLAVAATAQMPPTDSGAPGATPGQVLSDARPLPAEDRESTGAVLLRDQPVRAQQDLRHQLSASGERTGIPSAIGRSVSRLLERSRSGGDVQEAEAQQAPR
jgi:hypothetical protein